MAPSSRSDLSNASPQLKIALAALGGLAGAVLVLWPLASYYTVSNCEQPAYETLLVLGKKKRSWYDGAPAITIRKYKPFLVAEVEVSGSGLGDATSRGFRQIANFIFGNNAPEGLGEITPDSGASFDSMAKGDGEQIAMTTPVSVEMAGPGKHVVTFVMPSKFSQESLPKPRNPAIRIKEVPGRYYAALSWRGGNYPSEGAVEARLAELRSVLQAHSIAASSDSNPKLYGYYPPFAAPPLKLYDVLLEVQYEAVGDKLPVVDVSKAPDGAVSFADKIKQSS